MFGSLVGTRHAFFSRTVGMAFYISGSGVITPQHKAALHRHGLRAFFGCDASAQPGQLQEVMLHEAVVAWMRERLKTLPTRSWAESFDDYGARLNACAAYISDEHDVAGFCRQNWTAAAATARANGLRGKRNQLQASPIPTAPPNHHDATRYINYVPCTRIWSRKTRRLLSPI